MEKKREKEEMQIKVWEGKEGRLKIQKQRIKRGRLTKDGRDVAWVGACDMEMTGGR